MTLGMSGDAIGPYVIATLLSIGLELRGTLPAVSDDELSEPGCPSRNFAGTDDSEPPPRIVARAELRVVEEREA
jgi:hypothetical protein